MLINELPRYEILDEGSMQELERGWRRPGAVSGRRSSRKTRSGACSSGR